MHGQSISESSSIGSETNDVVNDEKAKNSKTISNRYSRNKDLSVLLKEIVEKKEGGFLCKLCDKSFAAHGGIYVHVRDKHLYADAHYKCQQCNHNYSSENTLRQHYYRKHPNFKVDAEMCRVPK